MKHYFLLLCLCMVCSFSCSDESSELDVVNGVEAVASSHFQTELVNALRNATTDEERTEILQRNSSFITARLTRFLKYRGYECDIDSISYRYGSGKAQSVESGDGNRYSGVFKNQPYAVVYGDCFGDQLYVFIRCFNGTFSIMGDNNRSLVQAQMEFTIQKGEGINHYTDFQTSIWLAERFNLPVYKGKGWSQQISYQEAYDLEPLIDSIRVKVKVNPGDRFNLSTLNYYPAQ